MQKTPTQIIAQQLIDLGYVETRTRKGKQEVKITLKGEVSYELLGRLLEEVEN